MGVNSEIAKHVKADASLPAANANLESNKPSLKVIDSSSNSVQLPVSPEIEKQREIERLDGLGSLGRLKAYTSDKILENGVKLANGTWNAISCLWSEEKRSRGWLVTLQEVNVFKYAAEGVIDPAFGLVNWVREEATRASLVVGNIIGNKLYPDSKQAVEVSYRQFREMEDTETLLKVSKGLFTASEILLSLAMTIASGGAAAGQTAVKARGLLGWVAKEQGHFLALANRLKVSAYFGGVGAVSEELLQGEDKGFNFKRALESTAVGMYYSIRFGMLSSRLPSNYGGLLDKSDALGDLHEVAFTDTSRVFKPKENGEMPSTLTIARRLIGLAGKTHITLADLKDEAGAEVDKIYQNQSEKSEVVVPEEIRANITTEISQYFLGMPKLWQAKSR